MGFALVFAEMTKRGCRAIGDLFREESKRLYNLDAFSTMEKVGVNVEHFPFLVLFVGELPAAICVMQLRQTDHLHEGHHGSVKP